ncbi:MAG TPA: ABC transporter substrate binding protein [Mobilitalea sp.]|nr:ABC transporter substrate binding protein [Mobilitalea sp.]
MTKLRLKKNIIVIITFSLLLSYGNLSGDTHASELIAVKNVLILNSYHEGFTWSEEETDGILNSLSESGTNLSIMIEYMDWKRFPNIDNLHYLYDYYLFKYQDKKFDVIIATDDVAMQFALINREVLFSNAPVVFCGVNQSNIDNITSNYDKVTGAVEIIDPTETIKTALSINPSLKNIYLLYDNTESGLSTGLIAKDKINDLKSDLNIISMNRLRYSDIIKQVQILEEDSIVLITTYYSDIDNMIVNLEYLTREVAKSSSVPVYHLYDFGINNGSIGGTMLSGELLGNHAGSLALRVIQGENIDDIPIITPNSYRTVFDYEQMERFGISLKSVPRDSEIINKPFSFYETYKSLVQSVLIAFLVLIAFVCMLLFYISKIRRMKRTLSDSHEELTKIYDELAASGEEMKHQYNEIIMINKKISEGEDKLSFMAYHDSLTGLPNKMSLFEKANFTFVKEKGNVALLFIDVDNFKYVNDTLGHAFGDQLIVMVSERLLSIVDNKSSLYHLGGDEFILIIEGITDISEAEFYSTEIILRFSDEFSIKSSSLYVSVSIGIAIYPDHGEQLEQLLKYADIAMYHAKEAGRRNYVVYDQIMNRDLTERVEIEKQLHKALENNEFEIFYQPQIDLISNKITGMEALLRWNNPVLGSVSPLRFIKIAEDNHFIIPIGTWVLQNACLFLKELNEKGFNDLTISVNLSILQLLQTNFCDIVRDTIESTQIKPQHLELEITESILMESFESITPKLQRLSDKKVRIALDDFGKGYSSLNYLKQLPIDTLKVDKSFIDNITDRDGVSLTEYIVKIGKSLGMCVIAEGVERQEQLEYLLLHKCDKIQGYLYYKPIPGTELIDLLENSISTI